MKLEIVTETFPPEVNGVAMTLERIASGMLDRGHDVGIVRPRQGGNDRSGYVEGLRHSVSRGFPIPGYAGLRFGLPSRKRFMRDWGEYRPDLIHVATEGPLGWSAIQAARNLGIPVVSSYHTKFSSYSDHYNIGFLRRQIGRYLRFVHNRTQATLAPSSDSMKELYDEGYRNLYLLERGVDTKLFSPMKRDESLRSEWKCEATDTVALYVGRLAKEKNLDLLIESYEQMKAISPSTRLVVVGDGPERGKLQRVCPEIEFAGTRRGEDLARHYASADVFLFSSLTETFGNVAIEAMSSGLYVLAYDYAAASRFVRSGASGRTVGFGNRMEFLKAAREIASNRGDWDEIRAAARVSVLGYSWNSIVEQYEQLLDQIVAKRNGLPAPSKKTRPSLLNPVRVRPKSAPAKTLASVPKGETLPM